MNFRIVLSILFLYSVLYMGQNISDGVTGENVENQPETYFLKDIVIDGVKRYTPTQILRFTGLVKGESLNIPGQKVSNAVKKLWETNQFSEVEVYVQDIDGKEIVLRFLLRDLKELGEVKFNGKGVGSSKSEKFIKDYNLKPGTKITQNLLYNLKTKIAQEYIEKGFADTSIKIHEKVNATDANLVDWTVEIDRGKKVKIDKITFEGNKSIPDRKLRGKGLKETKQKRFLLDILKPSKFIKEKYEEDKINLINYYNSLGFRDARIISDSVWRDNKGFGINIKLDEGKRYYIGDINFTGNTVYSTEFLNKVLSYKKGDIYDAVGFNKKVGEDGGKEDDSDLKSLYLNNGYLFSQVIPIERGIREDSIDLDIRIREGERATWNRVSWSGNVTTRDHVILRSLRTRPGDLFSRRDIKRTYFDLAGMQFFDPQQVGQDIKPNPQDNTVDIHWSLVEKGSSQVQLQAGYGGNTFIGTLALTFNNFSLRNFLRLKDFKPIPQGDGQTLSLQVQAGMYTRVYSASFIEPWIFGKKSTALNIGISSSIVDYRDTGGVPMKMNIFQANLGLNRLLEWPDNYFSLYSGLSYQSYDFDNYPFQFGQEQVSHGNVQNFAVSIGLSRNSAGFDPIFPTQGSNMEINLKLTPPYSFLSRKDYLSMSLADRYRWMEYYKVKLKADTYNEIIGKFVIRSTAEMGFMGGYNDVLGAPPFERYYVGGIGMFAGRYDGRELIPLRGYENSSTFGGEPKDVTPFGGATIYNRFSMELRYPISTNQTAKIYALTFLEGGNSWNSFGEYNPFQLKRSAGIGVRVYMGAFGLIGFDFAYGFDRPTIRFAQPAGWNTHFLMNQML